MHKILIINLLSKILPLEVELRAFIYKLIEETGILLDPIYTAKMMFGVFNLMKNGYFENQSRVVAVHTGGLQGWDGVRYMESRNL
jgi:1-aminocyclopropane-1-carboxylate deaminase